LHSESKCFQQKIENKSKNKIRVGYFSSDFRNHAVSNLTAELFELHDKETFEIYAFSSGPKNSDEQKQRIEKSFHEFFDVADISDGEVVNLARDRGIDIAIDLAGYTENARIGIFERRAAPIQASYLGYLGTLGVPHMDYIFADREIIPPEYQQFYTEKTVYLPGCFQINDRKRTISNNNFARSDFGLPSEGFVFCCFNNSYKITPEIFASWCQILQRVDGSVLWLYEANKGMVENLRLEASSRGVNPDRLIFSGALPIPEYLARYRLADLFLDTFPYNAGTTASDALWAGLPVLTLSGKTFASRMAGSILKAIDLPELVTHTIAEYENLAEQLATNKPKLKAIQTKVADNRMSTPLFDSPRTTKNIEKAYQIMYERYLEGKNPKSINLA
jgi:predicted O-linked N-acetylglucosamine transferase (SPINDLY family)